MTARHAAGLVCRVAAVGVIAFAEHRLPATRDTAAPLTLGAVTVGVVLALVAAARRIDPPADDTRERE
jgi:hypothetical protein